MKVKLLIGRFCKLFIPLVYLCYLNLTFCTCSACETASHWVRFNLLLFYHQMAPRDCQTLAGSLLGFLAMRAVSPLVTVHVFSNIFSRLTSLNGEQSFCLSFSVAHVVHVSFVLQKIVRIEHFCCTCIRSKTLFLLLELTIHVGLWGHWSFFNHRCLSVTSWTACVSVRLHEFVP